MIKKRDKLILILMKKIFKNTV